MSSEASSPRAIGTLAVVAIARDNSVAHGYHDLDDLLRSEAFLTGTAVEFFDADGHRLAPVFDAGWQFVGLEPTADAPDAPAVQRRLCAMVNNVNFQLRNDPEVFATDTGDAEHRPADVVLPAVDGFDLRTSLEVYTAILGHAEEGLSKNSGGPVHNFLHALGRRHR